MTDEHRLFASQDVFDKLKTSSNVPRECGIICHKGVIITLDTTLPDNTLMGSGKFADVIRGVKDGE